jgi:hypothetical protein
MAQLSDPARLHADVVHLAQTIGPRHPGLPGTLETAATWIAQRFAGLGLAVRDEPFAIPGAQLRNVVAELSGPDPLLVGAHYDSVPDVAGAPGADDNASGVAVLLDLAARAVADQPARGLRFVAFANEEGMRWGRERGGSWHHAATAPRPAAALILDSLGCYDRRPGSQRWPAWWMPLVHGSRGDFLCVQAAWRDRRLARLARSAARSADLPVRGCWWPGQTWQLMGDQESFAHHGIPVIALTDTDRFRNPRFHRPSDRPDSIDPEDLGRAAEAAWAVLRAILAG